MRDIGSRLLEERIVCDLAILEETVRQDLGSNKSLATYLGVGEETARGYRLGHYSLPRSLFEKLQLLNPALRPTMITDAFWGQRKGGTLRLANPKSPEDHFRSRRLDSHEVRLNQIVPARAGLADIRSYDAVSPSLTLEKALAEHKAALAEFVGRILGDGSPIIAPTYSASEIESQRRMQSLVRELFGYRPEIKVSNGNYRIQLRRVCGRALNLLGIPLGRKSVANPPVPAFVMESGELAVWVSFLRGIFDDEAYVSERGIEIGLAVRQAEPNPSHSNLTGSRILDYVSDLLRRLGIQHARRRRQMYRVGEMKAICWFLRIPRREFRKVLALGLFLLPLKQEKLIAALKTVSHERT